MDTKTIRSAVLFLIAVACCVFGSEIVVDPGYDAGSVRKTGSTMSGDLVLSDGTRAASRAYVASVAGELEALLQQGSLRLYYRTATDSITGARILSTTPEGATESTIVYPALSATTYTQVNTTGGGRVSIAGIPGVATLTAGVYTSARYMASDQAVSTGRTVTGLNELWLVDTDGSGNPVFVASSSEYTVIGAEKTRVTADYILTADVTTGGTTRRFLEKHYRKRTGVLTGANPIITVYYGGTSEGIFSAPLPSEVVMRTDGTNADNPSFPGTVDIADEVKIATSTDAGDYKLQVAGNSYFNGTASVTGGLDVGGEVLIATSTDAGDYKLQVAGSQYTTGDLTIGGDAADRALTLRTRGFNGGYFPTINFQTSMPVDGNTNNLPTAQIKAIGDNSYSSHLTFSTSIIGTFNPLSERMRITSGGKVGIATTTPSEALTVVGNAMLDAFSSGSGSGMFFRSGYGSTSGSPLNMSLTFRNLGSGYNDGMVLSSYGGIALITAANTYASDSVRIMVDNLGHVGIGTTNPSVKLEVVGNASFTGRISASITEHTDNAAAIAAGLATGTFYRTGDTLKVVW